MLKTQRRVEWSASDVRSQKYSKVHMIYLITAQIDQEVQENARRINADGLYHKPISYDQMSEIVA